MMPETISETASRFHSYYVREMPGYKTLWHKIHLRKGFSLPTKRTTVVICLWASLNGYDFAVEVCMKDGLPRRADIIIPELEGSQVIEIMDTETNESLREKQAQYAREGITCIGVPARDPAEAIARIKKANNLK